MKIGFFTDDFVTVSRHPGRSKGLYVFDIDMARNAADKGKMVLFGVSDYMRGPDGGRCCCGRGKGPNHECFRLKNGVIEINENIKRLAVGESFYDCDAVVCGAIGYNLERKLAAAGVKVFISGECDIAKSLESFIDGRLEERRPF